MEKSFSSEFGPLILSLIDFHYARPTKPYITLKEYKKINKIEENENVVDSIYSTAHKLLSLTIKWEDGNQIVHTSILSNFIYRDNFKRLEFELSPFFLTFVTSVGNPEKAIQLIKVDM